MSLFGVYWDYRYLFSKPSGVPDEILGVNGLMAYQWCKNGVSSRK